MRYALVIHKDKHSDYGVTVPDLPGCFSAGSTLDEAIAMAEEAIELHLAGLAEEGQAIPTPVSIERHQRNPDYAGGIWAVVNIESTPRRARRSKAVEKHFPKRRRSA